MIIEFFIQNCEQKIIKQNTFQIINNTNSRNQHIKHISLLLSDTYFKINKIRIKEMQQKPDAINQQAIQMFNNLIIEPPKSKNQFSHKKRQHLLGNFKKNEPINIHISERSNSECDDIHQNEDLNRKPSHKYKLNYNTSKNKDQISQEKSNISRKRSFSIASKSKKVRESVSVEHQQLNNKNIGHTDEGFSLEMIKTLLGKKKEQNLDKDAMLNALFSLANLKNLQSHPKQQSTNRYEKDHHLTIKKIENDQLQIWLGKVYEQCVSASFHHFIKNRLTLKEAKSYCCEQILKNILCELKKFDKTPIKCIMSEINTKSIKILDHLCNKYPQVDSLGVNKNFKALVGNYRINNWQDDRYDLLLKSQINFKLEQYINYARQIMKFINFLIALPYENHPLSSQDLKISNFKYFQSVMKAIFQPIYVRSRRRSQDTTSNDLEYVLAKIQKIGKGHNMMESKKSLTQNQIEYAERVKRYTHYQIGCKIPQSTPYFTDRQIESGIIEVKSPEIFRVINKWTDELRKKLSECEQTSINRTHRFKSQTIAKDPKLQVYNKIPLQQIKWLYSIMLQQSKEMQQIEKDIKKNVFMFSNQLAKSQKSDISSLTFMSQEERMMGEFAVKMTQASSTYMLQTLNNQIHLLLETVYKLKEKWEKVNKYKQAPTYQKLSINLLTFKIGDIMRCKISSNQEEIIRIFNILTSLNDMQDSNLIKIIRVKDRLDLGTQDILINFMFCGICPCQIQLAITQKQDQKQMLFDKFNHFLYQLRRADLGPIMEMCLIWSYNQSKAITFSKQINKNLQKSIKKHQITEQFKQLSFNDFMGQVTLFEYPIICSFCNIYLAKNEIISKNLRVGEKYICCYCSEKKMRQFKHETKSYLFEEKLRIYPKFKEIVNASFLVQTEQQFRQGQIFVTIYKKALKPTIKYVRKIKDQKNGKYYILSNQIKNGQLQLSGYEMSLGQNQSHQQKLSFGQKILKNNKNFKKYKLCDFDLYFILTWKLSYSMKPIQFNDDKCCTQILKSSIPQLLECQKRYGKDNFLCCALEYKPNYFYYLPIFSLKTSKEQEQIRNNEASRYLHESLDQMKEAIELSEKNLTNQCFDQLPTNIKSLSSQLIQQLYLNHNKLQNFDFVTNMKKLKVLYLRSNLIQRLSNLPQALQELALSQNKIKEIQFLGRKNSQLTSLDLNRNQIKSMRNLDQFTNMLYLQLMSNQIEEIERLPDSIRMINLAFNKIKVLKNFDNLVNIQRINIAKNLLTKIQNLERCKKLKMLLINKNDLGRIQNLETLQGLQILHISNAKLKNHQSQVDLLNSQQTYTGLNYLKNLKRLFLQQNQISCILGIIGITRSIYEQLKNYQCFVTQQVQFLASQNIQKQQEQDICVYVPNLNSRPFYKLIDLSVQNNLIESIKDLHIMMPYLEKLNVSKNRLTDITELFTIPTLIDINMSHNSIEFLPQTGWEQFYSLQSLNLSYNLISVAPDLTETQRIKYILLSNNKIRKIPTTSFQCWNKLFIDLENNRIFCKEVSEQQFDKMLEFFNTLKDQISINAKQNQAEEIRLKRIQGLKKNNITV